MTGVSPVIVILPHQVLSHLFCSLSIDRKIKKPHSPIWFIINISYLFKDKAWHGCGNFTAWQARTTYRFRVLDTKSVTQQSQKYETNTISSVDNWAAVRDCYQELAPLPTLDRHECHQGRLVKLIGCEPYW